MLLRRAVSADRQFARHRDAIIDARAGPRGQAQPNEGQEWSGQADPARPSPRRQPRPITGCGVWPWWRAPPLRSSIIRLAPAGARAGPALLGVPVWLAALLAEQGRARCARLGLMAMVLFLHCAFTDGPLAGAALPLAGLLQPGGAGLAMVLAGQGGAWKAGPCRPTAALGP
jgi:hypothetical protein